MSPAALFSLLWLLATTDGALSGFRAAAGRNGLIDKQRYYLQAMVRGALLTQCVVVLLAILVLALLALSQNRDALWRGGFRAGTHLALVYGPCAVVVFGAYALRLLPSVDLRSFTNSVVFGPFTLARPYVALAGIAFALSASPRWEVLLLVGAGVALMLALEPWIHKRWYESEVPN